MPQEDGKLQIRGAEDPMAYYFQDVLLINRPDAVRLYLIRHGQAGNNIPPGQDEQPEPDPPLTGAGREQARRLGERIAAYGVDAIYSSPLQRSYETGMEIARRTGHEIEVLPDLREIDEVIEGQVLSAPRAIEEALSHKEIKARFERDPIWDNLPGAESSRHFRDRIVRAVDAIVEANAGRRVAITCHGGVIQSYVAEVLGMRSDFPFYCFNASITSVRARGDRRVLWRLNDVGHLEGAIS
jgi:probable phosphoglycerate mutase